MNFHIQWKLCSYTQYKLCSASKIVIMCWCPSIIRCVICKSRIHIIRTFSIFDSPLAKFECPKYEKNHKTQSHNDQWCICGICCFAIICEGPTKICRECINLYKIWDWVAETHTRISFIQSKNQPCWCC